MIHIAAKHVQDEMSSLQQVTRACMSDTETGGSEPTLVIKAKSISLKYLLKSSRIRFLLSRSKNDRLIYGLLIDDDQNSPLASWSAVERKDELNAVKRIVAGETFMLAMFNEAVVNICGGMIRFTERFEVDGLFRGVKLANSEESEALEKEVDEMLNRWHADGSCFRVLTSDGSHTWGPNQCAYVTNQLQAVRLDLLNSDEGGQQEQLAAWITDNLHPSGVFQNPVAEEDPPRELCDLLFTHEFGSILFESKVLALLSRAEVPKRNKLQSLVEKHIQRAFRQLAGASRNVRAGIPVLTRDGKPIRVERKTPPHCVVVVPDQSLLNGSSAVLSQIVEFSTKAEAFFNVVDLSQLFSLMMDANNLSHRSASTTPLMAFDYLLIERSESVIRSRDPGTVTLCRFGGPGVEGFARA